MIVFRFVTHTVLDTHNSVANLFMYVAVEIVVACQRTLRKRPSKTTPTTAEFAFLPLDNLNRPRRHSKPHPLTPLIPASRNPTPTPRDGGLGEGDGEREGDRGETVLQRLT